MMHSDTSTSQAVDSLRKAWQVEFKPPERLNTWQWAEKHLYLSERLGSYPGLYRTALTPYVKGPLEAFHTHERIVLCFGTQVAKTTTLFAMIGYCIDQDPGPLLFVLPTGDIGKRLSKKRLQILINDAPVLAGHKTGLDDDFQLLSYTLDRMTLTLVGSNSPASLSSDPIRYLIMDETDQFAIETSKDADAMSLAMERTKAFWNSRIVMASTPTGPEGNIWHHFNMTNRSYYEIPCLHCSFYQRLVFKNLRWPDLKSVRIRDLDHLGWYECSKCNGKITDQDKPEMLLHGQWVPEAPEEKWAGFHLNSLYAPWKSARFGAIAAEHLRCRRYSDKNRNFINSWLALPFDPAEHGKDIVKEETLAGLKQGYFKNTVPAYKPLITVGVDVGEHTFHYIIRAWANQNGVIESWLINWGTIERFDELESIFQLHYPCPGTSEMYKANVGAIDSGYRTPEVYRFCRKHPYFLPTKGMRVVIGEMGPIPWKKKPVDPKVIGGLQLFLVNTVYWKRYIYFDQINHDKGLPSAWHLPEDVDPTYLRHISSERETVKINRRGQRVRQWVLKKGYSANHFLDCEVLAAMVADIAGVRFLREKQPTEKSANSAKRTVTVQSNGAWLPQADGWLK